MIFLEELTKDELINLVREGKTELDEAIIVQNALFRRSEYATEQCQKFFELYRKVDAKVMEVITPLIPSNAKAGTKLYNVPPNVSQQYNALVKERDALWSEYCAWGELRGEATEKISEISNYIIACK